MFHNVTRTDDNTVTFVISTADQSRTNNRRRRAPSVPAVWNPAEREITGRMPLPSQLVTTTRVLHARLRDDPASRGFPSGNYSGFE